jgi:hypothetical protein
MIFLLVSPILQSYSSCPLKRKNFTYPGSRHLGKVSWYSSLSSKKSFSTHPSPLHCQFLWLKLKPETFPLIPLPKGLSLEETHSKAIPAFDVAPAPPETI